MSDNNDTDPDDIPVKDTPGYYAIIPANIRYDKDIPANAKLLYGEITALCNKKGYCWAKNSYFTDLYQVDDRTIRRWINALKDKGYINISFKKKMIDEIEVKVRYISIADPKDNINTNINGQKCPPELTPVSGRVDKNVRDDGQKCPPELTKMSARIDKNVRYNITSNNIYNTTTTTAEEKKAEEAVNYTEDDLKTVLINLDVGLTGLMSDFYPRAIDFLKVNNFGLDYLTWIYEECVVKKPTSLEGFYSTLFFAENKVYKYRSTRIKQGTSQPEIICPVCGTSHVINYECPTCGLAPHANDDDVNFQRKFYNLLPEEKIEYQKSEFAILDRNIIMTFEDRSKLINDLKIKYGLTS